MLADKCTDGTLENDTREVTDRAREYVMSRTYKKAAEITANAIERARKRYEETRMVDSSLETPPVLPPDYVTELTAPGDMG
jgi:GH15 family glucan-1,4-alpha-glucosidase